MNKEIENDVKVTAIKREALNAGVSLDEINKEILSCDSINCVLKRIRALITRQNSEAQCIQNEYLKNHSEKIPSLEESFIILENETKKETQRQSLKL